MTDLDASDCSSSTSGVQLAPELVSSILGWLDPADAASGLILCSVSATCRLWSAASRDPHLWKQLYLARWKRHKSRSTHLQLLLQDGPSNPVDWKRVYGSRHQQDRAAVATLEEMVHTPVGRYVQAKTILQDHQMDVFDTLLAHQAQLYLGHPIYTKLSERLWAREVLDSLRRTEALQVWMQMVTSGGELSCIDAIGAFSGFRGCDRVQLENRLDGLSARVANRVGKAYLASRPDQIEAAKKICEVLGETVAPATDTADFHKLQNHFLNLVLDGTSMGTDFSIQPARTLPMSIVAIFCAVSQRLGLKASMIAFPSRILARISGWVDAPTEEQTYILDVFEGGRVLSPEDINIRLSYIGIPRDHASHFLRPARSSELVARVGRNIIQSLQRDEGVAIGSNDISRSAHAAVAALLFLQPNNLIDALPNILNQFPMDVFSIENDYVPVVLREGAEGLLMADRLRKIQRGILEKDATEIQPRLREQERKVEMGDDKEILYKLGTTFRHRRWGYVGVIKRWDPRCCADVAWILANNVDALENGGRNQPFYSISADDGSDRYIAQINVVPMQTVAVNTVNRIVQTHEELGLTFSRAEPEKGIFVLENGHRQKYPEDAAWQDEVLAGKT